MQRPPRFPAARLRRRPSLLVVGVIAALAVALPASASAAAFTAHVKFPNHTPIAGKKWPITVTATRGRSKLSGTVSYKFYSQGTFEKAERGVSLRNGVAHDTLLFPGLAVGHPLTLQVVVKTKYGTDNINWSVTTKQ